MEISVLIGSIATTLLNFNRADDAIGFISASIFTLASLVALVYSAWMFVRRAVSLRRREANVTGVYYDRFGPTILCFVLGAAILTNVGMRMTEL